LDHDIALRNVLFFCNNQTRPQLFFEQLHINISMVLCLYFFERRIIWIWFLHHRKKRKRIHQVIHLLPGVETDFPFIALSCVFLNIIAYCAAFYLTTKLPFGDYDPGELLDIALRFYICFIMFCAFGAAFSLLPINFQNSNTLLSIFSFCMLILGVMSTSNANHITDSLNLANPLTLASHLMEQGLKSNKLITATIFIIFIITLHKTFKHLRINPVWSRY
jgi:phosphoglycerol transferase MdoB-like AlkP superfamily enzyme